jgi:hypothetical protein
LLSSRNGLSGSVVISDTDKKESFDLLDINTPRMGDLQYIEKKDKTIDEVRNPETGEAEKEPKKKHSFLGLFGLNRVDKRMKTDIPKTKSKETNNQFKDPVSNTGIFLYLK